MRAIVLIFFSFRYVDQDQVTMMLSAKEMVEGLFHEPCFWGQRYGFMLEALLSVPLLWGRMAVEHAVPLVTCMLGILPFLIICYAAIRNGRPALAAMALAVPLIYTVEYDILTSMPRGWVAGLAVSSVPLLWHLKPQTRISLFVLGLCGAAGLIINPNSIYLTAFIGAHVLVAHRKLWWQLLWILAGTALPLALFVLAQRFYDVHPGYDFHGSPSLRFSIEQLIVNMGRLDDFFRYVAPVAPVLGWAAFLLMPVAASIIMVKLDKVKGVIYLILFACAAASLGIEKVNDSHAALFFSGARFFFALPILTVFLMHDLLSALRVDMVRIMPVVCLIAALGVANSCIRLGVLYPNIEKVGKLHWVSVDEVSAIKIRCAQLNKLAKQQRVELIIFENDADQLLNYGCPCFTKDFPPTLFPWYERRTWLLQEASSRTVQNILFVNPLKHRPEFSGYRPYGQNDFVYKGNRTNTLELLNSLNYVIRPF